MSYDLRLYKKQDTEQPIDKKALEKLDSQFDVTDILFDDNEKVKGFSVSYKNENDPWEFYCQDDGSYWTYVSYGAKPESFVKAKRIAKDVASTLELLIQDPQVSEKQIEPADFSLDDPKSQKAIDLGKKSLGI